MTDTWGDIWGFYWRPGKIGHPYAEHIKVTDVSDIGEMHPAVEAEARRLLAASFTKQTGRDVRPEQIYLIVRNFAQETS